MEPLIYCDHITKKVGSFMLRDICFGLEPGYILSVIGSNGAGKSTLVRILLGSYKLYNYKEDYRSRTVEAAGTAANQGDVFLEEYSIKRHPKDYKERIAFVMNDCPFAMDMSVKDNGKLYGGYYEAFDQEKFESLCIQYGISFDTILRKLSKGEQIKMQLAFALSHKAKLYIFDEPAGNLDVEFREEFYEIMRDIVKDGDKSIIYVTHLVEELDVLTDYVLWIEDGRQKSYGTMEELLDQYRLYSGPRGFLRPHEGYEIIGSQSNTIHREILVRHAEGDFSERIKKDSRRATLKEIMYYEKEGNRS